MLANIVMTNRDDAVRFRACAHLRALFVLALRCVCVTVHSYDKKIHVEL